MVINFFGVIGMIRSHSVMVKSYPVLFVTYCINIHIFNLVTSSKKPSGKYLKDGSVFQMLGRFNHYIQDDYVTFLSRLTITDSA